MRRAVAALAAILAALGIMWFLGLFGSAPGTPADPLPAPTSTEEREAEPSLAGTGAVPSPAPQTSARGLPVLGRVVDPDGRGLAQVRVVAFRARVLGNVGISRQLVEGFSSAAARPEPSAETRSGPDGSFRLTGLLPTTRYGFQAVPEPPNVGASREGTPRDLHGRPLILGVVPGSRLYGRVVDEEGRGVRAILSAWQRAGPLSWDTSLGRLRVRDLATDDRGRFDLAAMPPGSLYVTVRVPGRVRRSLLVGMPHPEELVIRLNDADGVTFTGTVCDPDGKPVAAARVSADIYASEPGVQQGALGMAVTDAQGVYRIDGLPAGLFAKVDAAAPGFLPTRIEGGRRRVVPRSVETIDLVLQPAATLAGHVRDPDGNGLACVHLRVQVSQPGSYADVTAVSDEQGAYRLTPLDRGTYTIAVRLNGWYVPAQEEGRLVADRPSGLRAKIEQAGSESTFDVVLRRGVQVGGRTVTADGSPVAGVEVRAVPGTGREYALAMHFERDPILAVTDAEGEFSYVGLAPGLRWTFDAQGTGLCGSMVLEDPLPLDGPARPVVVEMRPTASIAGRVLDPGGLPVGGVRVSISRPQIRVQAGHDGSFRFSELEAGVRELHLYSKHGRRIAEPTAVELAWGEVREDVVLNVPKPLPLAGVLVDADGAPMPYQHVVLTSADDPRNLGSGWPTDAEGRFEGRLWERGEYTAEVRGQQLEGTLTAGDTDVRLVFRPEKDRDLCVRILDPDGEPVAKVHVLVMHMKGGSGSGGHHDVTGGLLVLRRKSLVDQTNLHISNPCDAAGQPLSLLPTVYKDAQEVCGDLEIVLEAGRALSGTVFADDGTPVKGIRVTVGSVGPHLSPPLVETDADGRFEVVGVPAGPVELRVDAQSPWLPAAPLEVAAGTSEVVVRLARGRDFVVRVLDPDGKPVGGAKVTLRGTHDGQGFRRNGTTDEDGSFVTSGIPTDSTMEVRVTPPGPNAPWPSAVIPEAVYGDGEVVVQLETGVEIRGVVVDQEGRPVTRANVSAQGLGVGRVYQRARARLDGVSNTFVLGPLRRGRYRVETSYGGGFAPSRPVEVEAPAAGVRIVVTPAVEVRGRVQGTKGETMTLRWIAPDMSQMANLDDEGAFEIRHLRDEPGTIYVAVPDSNRYAIVEDVKPSDGPFELQLEEGLAIRGRIEDYVYPKPYGFGLDLRRGDLTLWGLIDAEGNLTVRAVPPGRYTLELWYQGVCLATHEGVEAGRSDLVLPMPVNPEEKR